MRQPAFDPVLVRPILDGRILDSAVLGDPSTAQAASDWPGGHVGDAEHDQDPGPLLPARGLILGVTFGAAVWLGCGALALWITCL